MEGGTGEEQSRGNREHIVGAKGHHKEEHEKVNTAGAEKGEQSRSVGTGKYEHSKE